MYFDMVTFANELLAQPKQVLTVEDEVAILHRMRAAQFLADKLENHELKTRVAHEDAR